MGCSVFASVCWRHTSVWASKRKLTYILLCCKSNAHSQQMDDLFDILTSGGSQRSVLDPFRES